MASEEYSSLNTMLAHHSKPELALFLQKEQADFGCRTLALLFICAGLLQIYLCGQQLWTPASSKLLFQLKGEASVAISPWATINTFCNFQVQLLNLESQILSSPK